MRILLVGGSKSGKTALALSLCQKLAQGAPCIYWATMVPVDGEDRARIARHVSERKDLDFVTAEGQELHCSPADTVLLDSVTAYLANEMFGGASAVSVSDHARALLAASRQPKHFVAVCDELWRAGENYSPETEKYRRGLAEVCRALAAEFDAVAEVCAGVPRLWKGDLPL